jgi:hypothetical protein
VKEITETKQVIIQENRGLRKQLNEAYDEISKLKERLD